MLFGYRMTLYDDDENLKLVLQIFLEIHRILTNMAPGRYFGAQRTYRNFFLQKLWHCIGCPASCHHAGFDETQILLRGSPAIEFFGNLVDFDHA